MCKSTPSKETFLWEADETEFLLSKLKFFNRQLEDPKGRARSPSEFSKIADTGIYLSKNIFDETGGESESKENRKQKLIEKLQIMSKLCK